MLIKFIKKNKKRIIISSHIFIILLNIVIFGCLSIVHIKNKTNSHDDNYIDVNTNYIEKINQYLKEHKETSKLPEYNDVKCKRKESKYNEFASRRNKNFILLDAHLIHPQKETPFEVCDILELIPDGIIMHHVKKYEDTSTSKAMSHLFNQGIVSIELITNQDKSLQEDLIQQLKRVLNLNQVSSQKINKIIDFIKNKKIKLIYQIIINKHDIRNPQEYKLPIFSRITLHNALKHLEKLNIKALFAFIPSTLNNLSKSPVIPIINDNNISNRKNNNRISLKIQIK
ncbi:TIGR04141 family sporadically distributed protein ['Fragaria x ananassa' phyllody phytoplasma]|uniref:TIGR04141 family sporadically distributed protein n=1 Tax='Fragaria x ananassa' phyllody phytoplasma TaxID=2358428 RepID=A0ABS5K2V1_9MOLU|nr:TIGR04141 family sporadically distributed protein ['Fragaria x ananassa' phyllody phytoplasma]MBS2126214.1 TIGR04141 family sporadically distributed protein ['Fragaria x ananassa' phyllody phytoplasma]